MAYVLPKISVTVDAGGVVFETLMGIGVWKGALIVVVAAGVYTIAGGLQAAIHSDMMQMFVLLFGAITVTVMGLSKQQGRLALEQSDQARPALMRYLMPVELRGVVAVLLAALMSSLSSVFYSCSTLISWDIYKKLPPGA